MKRLNMIMIAASAAVAIAGPAHQAEARTGEALAIAEKTCLDQGIRPHSTAFEKCVERVADAYDRTGQIPRLTWPTASIGPEGFYSMLQTGPSSV